MMWQRRSLIRALAALPLALAGGALAKAVARADAPVIILSGTAWYDDNKNMAFDPGEVAAPNVATTLVARNRLKGPVQAVQLQTLSDSNGHFSIAVPVALGGMAVEYVEIDAHALRPGYPYRPSDGYNYSQYISVPTPLTGSIVFNLPLFPVDGVIHRLPPESPPDFATANGHFFTQTNGYTGGAALGYAVTNADGVRFWDAWRRYGLDNIGYPLSRRFVWRGLPTQVFQKAILQWRADANSVAFINIFDDLHQAGRDPWLRAYYATPPQIDPSFDAGKSWGQIVRDRLRLLAANPAIEARYRAAADPLILYGLPTSRVEDMGNAWVIRTQSTVFQQWKTDTPWAKAGVVTLANGGEIAINGSLVPADWISPLPPD